jgi:hypothetical protein
MIRVENTMEQQLISSPYRPRLHGPKGICFLLNLRISINAMGKAYDVYCPTSVIEMMALNAVDEPMLISPKRAKTIAMSPIARVGIR